MNALRWVVGAAWALGIILPDLTARGWPNGLRERVVYGVASIGSLLLWLAVIEGVARLKTRRPRIAFVVIAALAIFLPLWVEATVRYYHMLHEPFPPSAACFFFRNPRYGLALARGATTEGQRWCIPAAILALALLLHLVTRRPFQPAPPWFARTRFFGFVTVATVLLLPKAARPADLEGLRSTIGGVGLWLATQPHLGRPHRVHPSLLPKAAARPNVLLLLQESLGAWQWSPWNGTPGSSPRVEALLTSGDPLTHWFPNAVTAAGATAVSVPSILTGLDSDSHGEAFIRAPLLWQEARVLGYRTALFSAEDYDWMSFRAYFLGAEGPDVAVTAQELGGARVNDNGVDDMRVVRAANRFIDQTPRDRPFLLVVQLNATHHPCWVPNGSPKQDLGATIERCAEAARYVDAAAMTVVDHLRALHRLDDTLVIGTADHGESFRRDRPPRLESYYEDVMRVPLWVRLPRAWALAHPDAAQRLRKGPRERVSNIDIYPTLLDVWGRWPLPPSERPALGGASLLQPLPPGRTLIAVNTGEIHDFTWSHEGFALYHGKWKWLCDEYRGCRLFDLFADPAEERNLRPSVPPAELAHFRQVIAQHENLRRILGKIDDGLP